MYSSMTILLELFDIAFVLVQGCFLHSFIGSFLKPRGKGRVTRICVALLYTICEKALDYVWPSQYSGIYMLGKQVVSLLLFLGLILCCYRAFRSITLFLVSAFWAVRDISVYVGVILLDKPGELAFAFWEWCGERGILTFDPAWGFAMNLTVAGIQLLRIALILLLQGLTFQRIVKDFREREAKLGRTELLFILIPALTGLMLCSLLRVIMITMEEDIPVLLYQKYPSLALLLPVVLLLSLLSILEAVRSYQELISLNREKNSRALLEKQVEDMQAHMRERDRVDSDLKSIRHDMKNILAVISSLAGQQEPGKEGELQEYLRALGQTMEQMEIPFHTGNQVVDALLWRTCREAQETLPELKLEAEGLHFPDSVRIRSYDLGILLGNALDNAFAACVRLKDRQPEAEVFIRLLSFQRGKLLFLRVENSFDGRLVKKPHTEFPATDKPEGELHGIGMPNMKRIAERYQGTVDWNAADGIFTLAVMLKNPVLNEE